MNRLHQEILRSLLSVPTAPFAEAAMAAVVRTWAGRFGLNVKQDRAGNLFLRHAKARASGPRWVYAAHMDHPGFIALRQKGRTVWAQFRGGVRAEFFPHARIVLFAEGGPVRAVVESVRRDGKAPWQLCRARLDESGAVAPGTIGMWDLPAMRLARGRLASRACDDVVGCAAVVCALGEIASRDPSADVTGLLTVAEEAGLVGATAACLAGSIPRGSRVVAIETSAAQRHVPLGSGVVVRVGDRAWTFDPSLTAHVAAAAAALAKRDKQFRFTRQLMPGGVCESTAYCLWGYSATGLCLPLGNYHNMGEGNRIAAERVDAGDFESLVTLLVALPQDGREVGETGAGIRKRLAGRLAAWKKVRGGSLAGNSCLNLRPNQGTRRQERSSHESDPCRTALPIRTSRQRHDRGVDEHASDGTGHAAGRRSG